jgi:hypothetical protein
MDKELVIVSGVCTNIQSILQHIRENCMYVDDSLICELADIEPSTLQRWRKTGRAKAENVQRLVDSIQGKKADWDGGPESTDCAGSSSGG